MVRRGLRSLALAALEDLFDQSTAFGRLAFVHVIMMAGDTLVAVSLAGSLFFSVSPHEAKSKVLAYLALTIAPFAVVSPILGPLIDRSSNGRRVLVALSSGLRVVLAVVMMRHLTSWLLFPEAFAMLVLSKLYAVTRSTLVPEMARTDQLVTHPADVDDAGWPRGTTPTPTTGFAGFNAQLTLLGTAAGLVMGSIGAAVLKTLGAPSVLVVAAVVFALGAVAAVRLPRPVVAPGERQHLSDHERDLTRLNPYGTDEVVWGLSATAVVRGLVGFTGFLFVFALRREHATLAWYGAAVSASGVGSLLGLALVTRLRRRVSEAATITGALVLVAVAAGVVARTPSLGAQLGVSVTVAIAAAMAQPSFDAITQRVVPPGAQGQTFARLAVRQQLAWVVGSLLPVACSFTLPLGDELAAGAALLTAVIYLVGRPRDRR
jgi:Major Facilitator Superfamily